MHAPSRPVGDSTLPLAFRSWLQTIYSWIRSKFNVVSVSTTYTVPEETYCVLCDATSGAFTVTLPAATGRSGWEVIIKKTDASANAITIGATIDGAVNPTLAARYNYKRVLCDGTNWNDVT